MTISFRAWRTDLSDVNTLGNIGGFPNVVIWIAFILFPINQLLELSKSVDPRDRIPRRETSWSVVSCSGSLGADRRKPARAVRMQQRQPTPPALRSGCACAKESYNFTIHRLKGRQAILPLLVCPLAPMLTPGRPSRPIRVSTVGPVGDGRS
jgi:hypothetical protein